MNVQRGDRVRLAPNLAIRLMRGQGRKPNWLVRRGVVIRVSAPADNVTVKWDDRASIDSWPTRARRCPNPARLPIPPTEPKELAHDRGADYARHPARACHLGRGPTLTRRAACQSHTPTEPKELAP